jgi:hypothetical protein
MSKLGIINNDNSWKKYIDDVTGQKPVAIEKDRHDPLAEIDETEKEIVKEENKTDFQLLKDSQPAAKIITLFIDMMQSGIFASISGEDSERFKLSDSDKKTYCEAWAEYLKDKGDVLTPGVALLLATAGIFIPNGIQAFRLRKVNKNQLKEKHAEK